MGGLLGVVGKIASDAADKLGPIASDAWDKGMISTRSAIEKIDIPVTLGGQQTTIGKYAAELLQKQHETGEVVGGQVVGQINDILGKVDPATRIAAAAGQVQSPELQQVRALGQQLTAQAAARNGKSMVAFPGVAKLPLAQLPDFMPKVLKDEYLKPGTEQQSLIDHLINTNQLSRGDAEAFANHARGMQYGPRGFEFMHNGGYLNLPADALESDPLIAFSQWGQSIAKFSPTVDLLGQNNVNLKTLVAAAGQDSYSAGKLLSNAFDVVLHGSGTSKYYEPVTALETTVKEFEYATKLGRVSIPMSSKILNTLIMTDVKSMAKSIGEGITDWDGAKDFAMKNGVLNYEVIRDMKAMTNGRSWIDNIAHYTGLDAVNKARIVVTANAMKHYISDMTDELVQNPGSQEANTMLKGFGLEPSMITRQGGQLTPQQFRNAIFRGTEQAQFLHNPLDLPMAWQKNSWLRVATLYKTFLFKEAKFVKDRLFVQSIKAGKFQNLAYAATLFPVVGELIGDVESLSRGQNPADRGNDNAVTKLTGSDRLGRLADNYASLGHIGMFMSVMDAFNRNNISQWLVGPVGGDIQDLGGGAYRAVKGDGFAPLGKSLTSKIPVIGPAVKNTLWGK